MFHSVNKFRTPVTILLSLIAVSFMGYGFVSLQGISRDNYIVKVGDQIITRYALDQAVQNTEAAGEPASREAVFQTLLQRAYLLEGAKQLGIVVSDEQIKQIVVDNPQFHDTSGKFDPKLFQASLTNTRQSEESFMQAQRENLSVAALLQTLNSNAVSDFQAQQVINAVLAPRSTRAYVLNQSENRRCRTEKILRSQQKRLPAAARRKIRIHRAFAQRHRRQAKRERCRNRSSLQRQQRQPETQTPRVAHLD